jgi:hypothetical protein
MSGPCGTLFGTQLCDLIIVGELCLAHITCRVAKLCPKQYVGFGPSASRYETTLKILV